jgi:5-formyltetrahydrofolate cyclo-ligase
MPIGAHPDPSPDGKARVRREARARRHSLPPGLALKLGLAAVHRAWSLPCLARARHVALYLPADGELDCTPFAVQAWRRGRRLYLPVISGRTLHFAPFHPGSDLRPNRYGIPEPVEPRRAWRTACQLDVIIAPLVAFDAAGRRLGMGGGYYDRTLARRHRLQRTLRPRFIALAYDAQKFPELPADAWDVHLDAVVTESATYRFA